MTEQSSRVRKAVEAISALPEAHSKEFDEAVESLIERHCHVTEMEAVVEKARVCLTETHRDYLAAIATTMTLAKLTAPYPEKLQNHLRRDSLQSKVRLIEATLSSIDALKGDKR